METNGATASRVILHKIRAGIVLVLWLGCISVGSAYLLLYRGTPGEANLTAPLKAGAELETVTGRPTLVLFAHPRCACSAASMEELARIRAWNREVAIRVYFYEPRDAEWPETDLWEAARRIPGARAAADPGGRLAALYGARTSGDTLLYDAAGRLAFSGGITAARGHYGDNDGSAAIRAILRGERPETSATPVYGCGLARRS